MTTRAIITGALGAALLLSTQANATPRDGAAHLAAVGHAFMAGRVPAPKIRVPGPRDVYVPVRPQVQLAQAGDPRIMQLEEQVRSLNGLVEELNFQVLQMQDQLQRMQEDNEFRFQQLEGGGGQGTAGEAPADRSDAQSIEEVIETPDGVLARAPQDGQQAGAGGNGEPPRNLGQITFDAQGNARQSTIGGTLPGVETGASTDQTQVAALPATDNPEELYRNSYEFILSGDYATAEAGFRDYVERFPQDDRAADAHFWLGESLLAQERYQEAAQTFLVASRDYPDARKAPDTLLKLGMSLAAMNQRDVACATLAEVSRKYPNASQQILARASEERSRASC